jgi:hypothetical protein
MAAMAASVGALIRELAASLKALPDREVGFPSQRDMAPIPSDFEIILAAKYRELQPPKLSNELREKLGLKRAS